MCSFSLITYKKNKFKTMNTSSFFFEITPLIQLYTTELSRLSKLFHILCVMIKLPFCFVITTMAYYALIIFSSVPVGLLYFFYFLFRIFAITHIENIISNKIFNLFFLYSLSIKYSIIKNKQNKQYYRQLELNLSVQSQL